MMMLFNSGRAEARTNSRTDLERKHNPRRRNNRKLMLIVNLIWEGGNEIRKADSDLEVHLRASQIMNSFGSETLSAVGKGITAALS